jgi:hypothetical protein
MVGVRILVVREREKRKEVVKLIFIPSFHQKISILQIAREEFERFVKIVICCFN